MKGQHDRWRDFWTKKRAAKIFEQFYYAADFGYTFIASGSNELAYGIVLGYDQSEQCQLLTELRGDNHIHVELEEIILNLGSTYKLSQSIEFLASAGTTLYSPERVKTYIAYLGIRWIQ